VTTLLLLAKEPLPGRVKTRLTPPCSPEQAADLAAAALRDTLDAVLAVPGCRPLLVLDGRPPGWLPAGLAVVPQVPGGLDERLAGAFAAAGPGPALLVGMDTPQVGTDLLAAAVRALGDTDAVFGEAADGGWWALGLRRPDPGLLRGVPTSRSDTGARQRARLLAAGLRVAELSVQRDVDTAADADAVAAVAPGTPFAALWRGVSAAGAGAA
jgi:rSAM/selenodomain-associated transferase 1